MRAIKHLASATAFGLALCLGVTRGADIAPRLTTYDLEIDRQPLDSALQQLARQCGLQIIFFSSVTRGLAAPAVQGNHTLESAMDELLEGSGLSFRVINAQTIEVRPQRMRAVRHETVAAVADGETGRSRFATRTTSTTDVGDEVVVVGVAEQLVASRIATPLRDIPQTVSIVTREQMRLQNAFDLPGVLENVPGITASRSSSIIQQFYARGYEIGQFHVDGGAGLVPASRVVVPFPVEPDLSEFDHVEVLRGADGLFGGNAKPGGTVSLVRKRAQRHFALDVSAITGSWDRQRLEIDVTGPLAKDGALRGRADLMHEREGYFFDVDPRERKKVFAAVDYDLTDAATLTLGGSFQWDDASTLEGGVPLYEDGRDTRLPRDTSLAFDWNYFKARTGGIYVQYRQEMGDWALKLNAASWRTRFEAAYGAFTDAVEVPSGSLAAPSGIVSTRPDKGSLTTLDVTVTGAFEWFGLRQEFAIGGDFTRSEEEAATVEGIELGPPLASVEDFDRADYPDPRLGAGGWIGVDGDLRYDHYGVFTSLRTHFNDAWSLIAGARVSGNRTATDLFIDIEPPFGPLTWSTRHDLDAVVTPFAAVTYAPSPVYSLYASFAEIYQGHGATARRPGKNLGPARGVNVEAGLKSAWRDGALNGSLVVFRTEQRNVPVPDGSIAIDELDDEECCFIGTTSRSKGVDLELIGEPVRGWMLGAGYTYNTTRNYRREPWSLFIPKHLFKAWTNYRMPGAWNRFEVGGSVHAQSRSVSRNTDCAYSPDLQCEVIDAVQRSHAVLDLRAAYDVTDTWQVALKLDNALDKIYYESIEAGYFHAWYGRPRNWMLRIDGRF